jgi:hypothetical protein
MSRTTAPLAAAGRAAQYDIDWSAAVGKVVWIPGPHRRPTMTEASAQRMLRCTNRSFAKLLDLGLPYDDTDEGKRFEPYDVRNAGLYSGTGVTDVEVAMRMILSFMLGTPEELTRPRRWRYRLSLSAPIGPQPRELRQVFGPTPEAFGGELQSCEPMLGPPVERQGDLFPMFQGAEVSGELVTCGAEDPVRAPELQVAVRELLDCGVRWQFLPTSLELDPAAAMDLGAVNCVVLCSILEADLRELGFAAASYRGWMVGLSQSDHGWVEVTDEDGQVRCLDPSFGMLAEANGFGAADFADLVVGSRLNRVVPTRARLTQPFVVGGDPAAATANPTADPSGGAESTRPDVVSFSCQANKQAAAISAPAL